MAISDSLDSTLNTILGNFSIPITSYGFKPLTDGFINDTYLVSKDTIPLYILQRVNHQVFEDMPGLMGNIDKALSRLDNPNYTKITLIKTNNGNTFLNNTEGYWRLMTYIDQTVAHNTTTVPQIAFEAGRIIGQFHLLLQDAQIDDYVDTIPRFHDLNLRKEQFQEATRSTNAEKNEIARDAINFAQEVLETLSVLTNMEIPLRVCHNDTKLNNILFSKDEDNALCLIDLDTIMKGYFYYDFGDAIRTIVNTAPEDEQNHDKITFEKLLFDAFIDGLASLDSFLSEQEIDTLHLGAIFMPFIHGLRALTDYLNGNVYYKVAYENQNLDRCRSLFNFTKKAMENQKYMEGVIRTKLR